jgi:4'-phosphopantetheinyl transferase
MNTVAVDVWRVRLVPDEQAERDAWALLTADERASAQRYHRADDRAARVRTRALLRTVLASRLAIEPRAVEIVEQPDGKPTTPGGPHFSVTHSRTLAAIAVSATSAVGIDIEPRRDFDWREVADRFLAPRERRAIEARPPAERGEAFFAIWVRKEAYLKGIGLGFRSPRNDVEVALGDGVVRDDTSASDTVWYLYGLDLDVDHAAALAVAAAGAVVAIRDARDL